MPEGGGGGGDEMQEKYLMRLKEKQDHWAVEIFKKKFKWRKQRLRNDRVKARGSKNRKTMERE